MCLCTTRWEINTSSLHYSYALESGLPTKQAECYFVSQLLFPSFWLFIYPFQLYLSEIVEYLCSLLSFCHRRRTRESRCRASSCIAENETLPNFNLPLFLFSLRTAWRGSELLHSSGTNCSLALSDASFSLSSSIAQLDSTSESLALTAQPRTLTFMSFAQQ